MASQQNLAPRAHRLLALGAVGLLAAATAIVFGRVFVGHGATWRLLAASLASVAVAGLLERRSLLVATLASTACLLIALAVLVFPQTTWVGLPTSETLGAIQDALGRVGRQARVQVAPTAPLTPLLLAAVTAVWTASFSAHALAIRAGGPLLAVLPSVALVGFTDTVMQDGARPGYAVILLSAVLLVCFVDGMRRIRQWGPVWGSRGKSLSATTGHGARGVAAFAVAVAVLVPGILPGFHALALIDFSTTGGHQVHIDPFVSIKAQLQRREPIDLFQVTSVDARGDPRAAYWRLFALDEFDGSAWRSSDPDADQALSTPATLSAGSPSSPAIDQAYRILTDFVDPWLPMAYPPQTVIGPFGVIRYDPELTAAAAPDPLGEGLEYSVRSLVVSPTPQELDAVSIQAPELLAIGALDRYTHIPESVPPAVRQIAEEWTENASTPYRQVLAIQQHFVSSGDFHYSLDVRPKADASALVDFLTKTRTGFCQQFAAAMAILVRELGIPARVAVGFRQGTQSVDTFTVTTEEAHSWVEVLFPDYGWLPFEPTPGGWRSPLATAGSYLSPDTPGPCPSSEPGCAQGGETTVGSGTTGGGPRDKLLQVDSVLQNQRSQGRGRRAGAAASVADTGYSIPYRLLLLALLALGALLLITVPIVKAACRRWMLHGARDPNALVLRAYRVFDGEAADLGLGRADGETLVEHRDRLATAVRFSDGHVDRLTMTATQAAYSARSITEIEASQALRDARTAIRDIRSSAGLLRRLRGVYRPGL